MYHRVPTLIFIYWVFALSFYTKFFNWDTRYYMKRNGQKFNRKTLRCNIIKTKQK